MSTRPEPGSPDELVWLRGFEEARNHFLVENKQLRDALCYIAFASPDQCQDIRFGIENNCLAEVYKAEAQRTLWREE